MRSSCLFATFKFTDTMSKRWRKYPTFSVSMPMGKLKVIIKHAMSDIADNYFITFVLF